MRTNFVNLHKISKGGGSFRAIVQVRYSSGTLLLKKQCLLKKRDRRKKTVRHIFILETLVNSNVCDS